MEKFLYYVMLFLTLCASYYIISIAVKNKKQSKFKITYTQSYIHQIIKDFLPRDLFEKPGVVTQSQKHVEKYSIKVLMTGDSAYWVQDNMFYVADTVNGFVDPETVRPIDTENMSQRDIDRMLFILDSLKNGRDNDSSGTGN